MNMLNSGKFLMFTIISLLISFQPGECQTSYMGLWEGTFMKDFIITINFSATEHNQAEGHIKMFNSNQMIQDDKIIMILFERDEITFHIPSKKTRFKGKINSNNSELKGIFLFPDGSEIPCTLDRKSQKSILDDDTFDNYLAQKRHKFSIQELQADLDFLFTQLKVHHPQLYRYTSTNALNELFADLKKQIDSELTIENFFLITSKLTEAIKCSHTGIRMKEEYQNLVHRFGNFFPLDLAFINSNAFYMLDNCHAGNEFIPGDEILEINNKPTSEIINKLSYLVPSEGNNLTTKYHELNHNFPALFYYLDNSKEFRIKYKSGDSINKITLRACSYFEIEKSDSRENKPNLEFEFSENKNLGLLRISSFEIRDMDTYFHQLDTLFKSLSNNGTQNLVLDLRNNKGGHPIFAAQLLSYLINHDFIYFKRNTDIVEFEPLYNTMQANVNNYKEKIFVLVNGGCLSTTGHLISLLNFHTNATFIGEEPGSTFQCNNYSIQLELPNTGLELNIPRTTFETFVLSSDTNIKFQVDHEVENDVQVIVGRKDIYLSKVFEIIREQ